MKGYNLYYKNSKINSKPLLEGDIKNIFSNSFINKKVSSGNIIKIPVNEVQIIKCTIL